MIWGDQTDKNSDSNRKNNGKQEDLDQKIEQVFQEGAGTLPEDKYFKKIWNSIETRAPVGEKYYLRSFFAILFFAAALVIFILFYSDFLSSMLTLKEIRKENAAFFTTSTSVLTSPVDSAKPVEAFEIARGIFLTSREKTKILVNKEDHETVELDFFDGHLMVDKREAGRTLIIRMPEVTLRMGRGKAVQCNIFCYDGIIRIIPVSHPVQVEYKEKTREVQPGSIFYLLNKKEVIIKE